jgi:hypothetical protein
VFGMLIEPLLLGLILFVVAREEARISFLWLFLIAVGVSVVAFAASRIHPALGMVAYVLLLPAALVRLVYVRWKIAWIATGVMVGLKAVLVLTRERQEPGRGVRTP